MAEEFKRGPEESPEVRPVRKRNRKAERKARKAQKMKEARKNMRRGGRLAAFLAAALLLIALGWRLRELRGQVEAARQERDQYQVQVEELERQNAALSADLEEGVTSEKMEEIARSELGMVLPGEYVFYNTDS